eukprot:TRINITY_DN49303_c0_g1_i1.p1 TRINITY_DN49303_c0_g1~~TRINITY_DN49303_c0_g1_i1.p1  ORF type:complete len:336 (-),score=66.57 TRINITY_DN49303_c0_g1_i1:97-1104(-)
MGNSVPSPNPFGCCLVHPRAPEVDFLKTAANKVDLAVTVLGGIPGLMAYHTSVLINGEEFSFSPMGIQRNQGLESHRRQGAEGELMGPQGEAIIGGLGGDKGGCKVIELGSCQRSGESALQVLRPYFEPGSYDLVYKNCNTFSDMTLLYLLGQRLDSTYNSIEKFAASNPSLLERVTGGAYVPNPRALDFRLDDVLNRISQAAEEEFATLPCGQRKLSMSTVVRVSGLQSEKAADLNGKVGVVQRYNQISHRYEVTVDGEIKGLRPENVEPFQMQQDMRIEGLQSASAQALNGERVRIVKFNPQTERLEVRILSTGEIKALKSDNLVQCCGDVHN